MGYIKKNAKPGAKKSERTLKLCRLITEELKKGDKSSYELEQMFGIKENLFPGILLNLTYYAPIYDYKVDGKLYLGLMK